MMRCVFHDPFSVCLLLGCNRTAVVHSKPSIIIEPSVASDRIRLPCAAEETRSKCRQFKVCWDPGSVIRLLKASAKGSSLSSRPELCDDGPRLCPGLECCIQGEVCTRKRDLIRNTRDAEEFDLLDLMEESLGPQ